jgi:putative ABC transport system permease protein
MYWFRRFLLLLPWTRRARERDLEEELRANLAFAIEDAPDSSPGAARLARRDFGNLARAHEASRALWLPGWDAVAQDVRLSVRTLLRAPAFTLVATLSLALGIGAAAALFSIVNTVVLKPLAYREPGRLIFIREVVKPLAHLYPSLPVNFEHFRFWRDNARSFESMTAIAANTAVLTNKDGEPETIGVANVSAAFFDTLGVQPRFGRGFRLDEEKPQAPITVVITDSLWRRRFSSAPSLIGKKIILNEYPCLVVGILPPAFHFPKNQDLGALTKLAERTEAFLPVRNFVPGWGGEYDFIVFGRLQGGVTQAQAAAELNLLEGRIVEAHKPDVPEGTRAATRLLQDVIASPVRTSLNVLLAAVLALVLIVCVNLANLLLARGSARSREYSLRIALGAARERLMVSALIETMLLSVVGGALGVAGAWIAVSAFARLAPVELPRSDELRVDSAVLAFALGLSLLCALLFGLLPALRLSCTDPQTVLRGETHTVTGSRRGLMLREWLVGGEVALSTLLLILAGLLVNSLWHVLRVDRGFASERTLDISLMLPSKYRSVADKAAFFDRATGALGALPGVLSAAAVNRPPLTGESNVNEVFVDGARTSSLDPTSRQVVMVNDRFVGDRYFATLGIPLLRGRSFEPADRDRSVALISARLAARLWPGQNPLGHAVTSGSSIHEAQIVGVVGDVHTTQLERDPTMMIYVPFWKDAYQVADLVIRSAIDPRTLEQDVRRAIQSVDSAIPPPKMRTMQELVDQSVAQRRFQMDIAAAFGIAALLLAALGIYGVVAYGISLRRRELGVRMALGARAAQVRAMVVGRGLRPVLAGLAVGIAAALAAGSFVRALLFGVAPTDALTLGGVAAALASVAVLACLLPAHSAARIDPARVLREE